MLTTPKKVRVNFLFIVIMGLLMMIPPLGIDMYLPSFLHIADDLHVSAEKIQHTLTFFAMGMSVGQLIWGPFGDSFGRRPIIILGLVISSLLALSLTQTTHIQYFIVLRFLQGFFCAASVVLVSALVRDLFTKNHFSKMMSLISLIFMIAPLIAPLIGGYLVKFFHWTAIFYVLALIGGITLCLFIYFIPETHHKEARIPLRLNIILKNFSALLTDKEIVGYILVMTLSFGGMFAFLSASSIVYISLYGVKVEHFGYFFMINIGVMMVASFTNSRLVGRVGAENILKYVIVIQLCAGLFLTSQLMIPLGFWAIVMGCAVYIGVNALIMGNATACMLERHPHIAGTANSMAGTIRFGFGSMIGSFMALVKLDTPTPMILTMGLCTLGVSVSYYLLVGRSVKSD